MIITNLIRRSLSFINNNLELYLYRRQLPKLVKSVRAKRKITVLFVLSELSLWKSESLYRAMLEHPRFDPILGITLLTCDLPAEVVRKYNILIGYLKQKGYNYIELTPLILNSLKPDITFYQQPYDSYISDTIAFKHIINNNGLVCDIHYSFRLMAATKSNSWVIDLPLYRYSWQLYIENEMNLEYAKVSLLKGKNFVVTGVPMQDDLLRSKECFNDPWKSQNANKKRIVYAPHHTLPNADNMINLSSFLDVCDYMLEIAEEFSEKVQFAFKPHPFLKRKLTSLWGEVKTNRYYSRWDELSNGQLVEGSYIDLFKHSDALIHDCDSFILEYCFLKKPILYLINPEQVAERTSNLNQFGRMAFSLHDYGMNKEDIRLFVRSVIENDDKKVFEREAFYEKALMPPNGKTSVDNIINAILGA